MTTLHKLFAIVSAFGLLQACATGSGVGGSEQSKTDPTAAGEQSTDATFPWTQRGGKAGNLCARFNLESPWVDVLVNPWWGSNDSYSFWSEVDFLVSNNHVVGLDPNQTPGFESFAGRVDTALDTASEEKAYSLAIHRLSDTQYEIRGHIAVGVDTTEVANSIAVTSDPSPDTLNRTYDVLTFRTGFTYDGTEAPTVVRSDCSEQALFFHALAPSMDMY